MKKLIILSMLVLLCSCGVLKNSREHQKKDVVMEKRDSTLRISSLSDFTQQVTNKADKSVIIIRTYFPPSDSIPAGAIQSEIEIRNNIALRDSSSSRRDSTQVTQKDVSEKTIDKTETDTVIKEKASLP